MLDSADSPHNKTKYLNGISYRRVPRQRFLAQLGMRSSIRNGRMDRAAHQGGAVLTEAHLLAFSYLARSTQLQSLERRRELLETVF